MITIKEFDFTGERESFIHLYSIVYGASISDDYCNWKFINNPLGRAIGFGAWDANTLVGFVALTPYQFCIEGKLRTASQGADTMVHPAFRGKGLFVDLTRRLLDEMNTKGWLFRYSAPGIMSYRGYLEKLEHRSVCILPYWVKFRPLNWVKRKLGQPCEKNIKYVGRSLDGLSVQQIDRFGTEYDDLWARVKPPAGISLNKPATYMNWRYSDHPLHGHASIGCYRNGLLVGIAVSRGGNILDVVAESNTGVYRMLISAVDKLMESGGSILSHAWVLGDGLLARTLHSAGWCHYQARLRRFGLYPPQPLIVYGNPGFENVEKIQDSGKWRFSMGDVDCM